MGLFSAASADPKFLPEQDAGIGVSRSQPGRNLKLSGAIINERKE